MTQDRIDELLREIEHLRAALSGRTLSCGYCTQQAKEQQRLLNALRRQIDVTDKMKWERADLEGKHSALQAQHDKLLHVVQCFIAAELSYRIREGRPRSATDDAMRDLSVRAYNWATTFAELQKCVEAD